MRSAPNVAVERFALLQRVAVFWKVAALALFLFLVVKFVGGS